MKKVCPVCRKPSLTPWLGFVAGIIYFCKNCGYRGPIAIKVEDEKHKK